MTRLRDHEQRELKLRQGTIRYRELGSGAPVLLVHGLLVNSLLWEGVAERLARDFRVIAPDWPLGSQELPLEDDADLSPPALAQLVADFMDALDLEDVTLVGNDTGGAICQIVAVEHPERLARLVLTPCDAYENFPPPLFAPLATVGRSPLMLRLLANALRPRVAQRSPVAYGWLSKRSFDREASASLLRGLQRDPRIRRQVAQVLRGFDKRYTLAAAEKFGEFDKPVLVICAPEDRFFKLRFAERLARDFPNAQLELVEDSLTFVSLDQPERTAELIAGFAREPVAAAA